MLDPVSGGPPEFESDIANPGSVLNQKAADKCHTVVLKRCGQKPSNVAYDRGYGEPQWDISLLNRNFIDSE